MLTCGILAKPQHLSLREREVVEWTGRGKTAFEAGIILGISEHTVAQHLKSIRRKLGCSNNAHAVLRAIETRQFGQAGQPSVSRRSTAN